MEGENERKAVGEAMSDQVDPQAGDTAETAQARKDFVEDVLQGIILPVCPHCGDDPFQPAEVPIDFGGGFKGRVFFCGNKACRKTINVQILTGKASKPTEPDAPPGRTKGGLILPA